MGTCTQNVKHIDNDEINEETNHDDELKDGQYCPIHREIHYKNEFFIQ